MPKKIEATVPKNEMAAINRQYHGQDHTTDVLTFNLTDPSNGDCVEADIVVCFDEATRQAARRGHQVRMEILLYAVHGLLHLAGYDDQVSAEADRMHEMEDQLLTGLGLPPVYATPEINR